MKRISLRYAALVLLGFGAGLWLRGTTEPPVRNTTNGSKTDDTKHGLANSPPRSAISVSRAFELAQQGGGLREDAELYEALNTMRAEDFHDAASLWTPEFMAKLGRGGFRIEAILDRWFELDPASAKVFAEKACTPVAGEWRGGTLVRDNIAASAARSDPKWALEHLLHELPPPLITNPNSAVMREAAKQDPSLAKEWLARMDNTKIRETLLSGYVEALAGRDPLAAMDFAIAEKGFQRVNLIPEAIEAASSQGRGVALEALAKIDDPGLRRRSAMTAMGVLAQQTNADIFQFFDDAFGRDNLAELKSPFNSVPYGVIERDPAAAANWAAGLPPEYRTNMLQRVLESWRADAPRAAMEWIEKQQSGSADGEESALVDMVRLWRANELLNAGKTQEAMDAFSNIKAGGQTLGNVASKLFEEDPAGAAQWALSLPEGATLTNLANTIAAQWTPRDPAAAAAWVEKLPAGKARDTALRNMIGVVMRHDPESASAWVGLYTDPKERALSIRHVYSNWSLRDPAKAREWVRTLPGVDEQWKTKFLRQNP